MGVGRRCLTTCDSLCCVCEGCVGFGRCGEVFLPAGDAHHLSLVVQNGVQDNVAAFEVCAAAFTFLHVPASRLFFAHSLVFRLGAFALTIRASQRVQGRTVSDDDSASSFGVGVGVAKSF